MIKYEYNKWGNMRCFKNSIVISGFILYNIQKIYLLL